MIDGDTITKVDEQSRWDAKAGPGCELLVTMRSGRQLFVIRSGLEDVEAELDRWHTKRVGTSVERTRTLSTWPLGDGGTQTTLDIWMEDGFRFEGDLIEAPERDDRPVEDLETEWTFEGTPGVEMGERDR